MTIVTLNHPKGLVVPIHWFGLQFSDEQFDTVSGLSEELNESTAEGIQTYDGVSLTFSTEDFIIKAPVTSTSAGYVGQQHDSSFLTPRTQESRMAALSGHLVP